MDMSSVYYANALNTEDQLAIIKLIKQCILSNRSQEPAPENLHLSQIIHC